MDCSIEIDVDSIGLSPSGSVTGIVYWKVDDVCFPEAGWNDFVMVVMEWWIEAALSVLVDGAETAEFEFMDGPYSVVISERNQQLNGKFIDWRVQGTATKVFELDRRELRDAVYRTSNKLCRHMESLASFAELSKLRRLSQALGAVRV